jgi:hypothetical protein
MLDLSVLEGLQVEKPVELANKRTVIKGKKKHPENGDFRITKQGEIYYSPEFRAELTVNDQLNHLDICNGKEMNFGGKEVSFMFLGIVPYTEPKASVQGIEGKVSFIHKKFLAMATELYGINWEQTPYVDFKIVREHKLAGNMFFIPRIAKTGVKDYVRRENVSIYPIVPFVAESEEVKVNVE